MKFVCGTLLGLLVATSAQAEGWKGQGEAGLIRTTGNTESENFNIGLNFEKIGETWSHELGFGLLETSADSETTAETISADYLAKRHLTDRSYLFGSVGYLDDDFDGFTEQSSIGFGYGYFAIKSDRTNLELGAGIGYRDTEELFLNDDGTETVGEDLSSETLIGLISFDSLVTDNTTIFNNFRIEVGTENTFIENELGLIVSMSDAFSLKASLLARQNSDPAPTADETDTISTLSLIYDFGNKL